MTANEAAHALLKQITQPNELVIQTPSKSN